MKKRHKLFLGLGTTATVLAPIAAVVACGNNNDKKTEKPNTPEVKTPVVKTPANTGTQTPTVTTPTNTGTQTPTVTTPVVVTHEASRTLAEIKTAAWDETSKTLDITKVKNTYELGLLLSDLTGFDSLKGIADDFKVMGTAKPEPTQVIAAFNAVKAKFEKVAHDFDFHIKNATETKNFSINVKALGDQLLEGINKAYLGTDVSPALAQFWAQETVGSFISQYDSVKATMTIDEFATATSQQVAKDDSLKAAIIEIVTNGQSLIDNAQQAIGDVLNIVIVKSLSSVIGLDPLMDLMNLLKLPLPAVVTFFEVLKSVSSDLDHVFTDSIVTTWAGYSADNPSSDSIKNHAVSIYDNKDNTAEEVLYATFGYDSIIA